tara:strand:+ start:3237 stop:4142 length:906 start_codon:yes stop_codon:yes gene_type:complete
LKVVAFDVIDANLLAGYNGPHKKSPEPPMKYSLHLISILSLFVFLITGVSVLAEDAAAAARKAQDPLADVKALMTDNTIASGTGSGQTSYNFQFQPVYSIPTDMGFNFILRGIIPVAGVVQGAQFPKLGTAPIATPGDTWGISDIFVQGFIVPESNSDIKFGFGPQVSLRSASTSALSGPGWGAGGAGVFFGFAGDLSYGGIVGHHWGQNNFSLTTVQPIVFYNTSLFGGSYYGYNNSITYDWSATSRNAWQVPLGLTAGKAFILDDGYMMDLNIGAYSLARAPVGGADWQFKFGVSLFFP